MYLHGPPNLNELVDGFLFIDGEDSATYSQVRKLLASQIKIPSPPLPWPTLVSLQEDRQGIFGAVFLEP
jgi:hypothetical protein